MFSSFCPETLSISEVLFDCVCLYSSLYCIFVWTKHRLSFPWLRNTALWFDIDRGKWLHAHIPLSHLYCKWQNGGQSGEKSWDEFYLRISLWNCDPAYYLNSNVKSAVKGHKDTAEICVLQTANWCLTFERPEAKLHTYCTHVTFDIRWRWQPGISAELYFTQLIPEKSQWALCGIPAFIFWYFIISYHIIWKPQIESKLDENRVYLVAGSGWGASFSLCVAVCVHSVPLRHYSLASSARTALLAPLVCLICSLHAEHLPIWPQAMERLALLVSALLRIVRSPLSNPPTGWPCRLQGN